MCSAHDTDCSQSVGSPIRTSPDHSVLTAPRSFSQLATSFIAFLCQGIPTHALSSLTIKFPLASLRFGLPAGCSACPSTSPLCRLREISVPISQIGLCFKLSAHAFQLRSFRLSPALALLRRTCSFVCPSSFSCQRSLPLRQRPVSTLRSTGRVRRPMPSKELSRFARKCSSIGTACFAL